MKCKGCGKKWCGTKRRTKKLYPDEPWMWSRTYGSRKCPAKAAKAAKAAKDRR